jgi:hypothetical protein
MLGHHQANNIASVIFYAIRIRADDHVLSSGRYARRHQALGLFIFHQTNPAGTNRL